MNDQRDEELSNNPKSPYGIEGPGQYWRRARHESDTDENSRPDNDANKSHENGNTIESSIQGQMPGPRYPARENMPYEPPAGQSGYGRAADYGWGMSKDMPNTGYQPPAEQSAPWEPTAEQPGYGRYATQGSVGGFGGVSSGGSSGGGFGGFGGSGSFTDGGTGSGGFGSGYAMPGYPEPGEPRVAAVAQKRSTNPGILRWVAVVVVSALIGGIVGAASVSMGRNSSGNGGNATVSVSNGPSGPAILANGAQIPQIVKKILPSVVSIKATGVSSGSSLGGGSSPFGSSPFGSSPFGGGSAGTVVDEGTGMIITSSGEVVTNNHVIAGATSITVTLYGQSSSLPAKLIGTDPTDDVALLQIENAPSNLSPVTFGKSSNLQVGDGVIAVGNALGLSLKSPTVTSGIVSALGRSVQAGSATSSAVEDLTSMIQTDAAINSGNSGGPLVDSAGHVIGMDTAVASSSAGNAPAQNIGFAIPSDRIISLLPQLRKGGTVAQPKAYLGVYITSLNSQLKSEYNFVPNSGAVVMQVEPGSPAQVAGIQAGDVIVAIDGQKITSASALGAAISSKKPGQSVTITLWQGQQKQTVTATLASTPVA
jgi:putative serine protease PepD